MILIKAVGCKEASINGQKNSKEILWDTKKIVTCGLKYWNMKIIAYYWKKDNVTSKHIEVLRENGERNNQFSSNI